MAQNLTAANIAAALGNAKPTASGGYMCNCPAHDDSTPSLWIVDRPEGGISAKGHAGCHTDNIVAILKAKQLWPTAGHPKSVDKVEGAKLRRSRNQLTELVCPVPSNAPKPPFESWRDGPPSAVYDYRDLTGNLIGYIARWDRLDGKDIRPFVLSRTVAGDLLWVSRGLPEPRSLFRGEQLAQRPEAPVLVVEGEKTTIGAEAAFPDHLSLTWPGGVQAIGKVDWSGLHARDVVLWPDNDDAGVKAMEQLAVILRPIARTVRLVALPVGLPPKWDLADPVPACIDINDVLSGARVLLSGLRPHVLSAQELDKLPIPDRKFIVEPFFVEGGLFMVYAERGLGKTWFALQASLSIAAGKPLFGFIVPEARTVLYFDGEMSLSELQFRLRALGGDESGRLFLLPSEKLFREDRPLNINSDEDQKRVLAVIDDLEREGRRPDLLIFDNLSSLSAGMDENDNSALDVLLRWLVTIKHRGIAVLLVHHAGKSGAQRGASRREDLLDTSIALTRKPEGEEAGEQEGANFIVTFPKTRGKTPQPAKFELTLTSSAAGGVKWNLNTAPNATARDQTLRELALAKPRNQNHLAELRGLSKGAISQHCGDLRRAGMLGPDLVVTATGIERLMALWPDLWSALAEQDDLPI